MTVSPTASRQRSREAEKQRSSQLSGQERVGLAETARKVEVVQRSSCILI